MRNIFCEFEISTYNTLCFRGPTKDLALGPGHFVFQNEAKNIPRQDFMVINISCKFEKARYNFVVVVVVRAVTASNKRVRGAPKGGLRTQETRLATALIKFRNKERNVRLPT